MSNFVITTDSTADLSDELRQRYGIRVIPLTIVLGEESFLDGEQFTAADLYRRFREDGTLPMTSAPSVQQYLDFFSAIRAEGAEIVHLTISAELSNSYQASCLAAAELEGVYCVDSRMLSAGVGLLAIEGAECRERGMGAAETAERLRALTEKVDTSFVLDGLDYMRKGGRCSGVVAIGANLLQLRPALMLRDGKVHVYKKYRGKTEHVYHQYIEDRLSGRRVRGEHVVFIQSGEIAPELLDELEAQVRELTGAKELHRLTAGCTICAHCGPKTIGLMFFDE